MLLSELYTLQKRVDEVESTIQASTPSPPKSIVASSRGKEMESRVRIGVGFTSPSTPLMASPAGRKGKTKAVKGKKRRPKKSKASTVAEEVLLQRSSASNNASLTLRDLSSSGTTTAGAGRKSPAEPTGNIPWAKTPMRSLPTRFTSSPPSFGNDFTINDSEDLFAPLAQTTINSSEEGRRPLLIAKKIYGHLVNLQGSYMSLKKMFDQQTTALGNTSIQLKRQTNLKLKVKEENEILRSRLRAQQSIEGRKAKVAQQSMLSFLNIKCKNVLGLCVASWKQFVVEQVSKRRKMQRFLKHWRYRHVQLIVEAWRDYVAFVKVRSDKLATFYSRWSHNTIYKALTKWKVVAENLTRKSENEHKVMSHFVRKMCSVILSQGFGTWAEFVAREKLIFASSMRVIRRWNSELMTRSFKKWDHYATNRRHLRWTLAIAMKRRKHNSLRPSFQKWMQYIAFKIDEEWVQEQDALKKEIDERDDKIDQLERFRDMVFAKEKDRAINVLNRILHSQLFAAWKIWKVEVAEMVRLEAVKLKIMNRWRLRGPQKMIQKWKAFVEVRKRVRNIVTRSFGGRSYTLMSAGFNTWKAFMRSCDHNLLRTALEAMEAKATGLENDLREKNEEIKDLQAFKDKVYQEKKDMCIAVLSKLMHCRIHQFLERWKEHALELGRQERLMTRFLAKWRLKPAIACLGTWKEYVAARLRLKWIMARAIGSRSYTLLDKAMRTWKHYMYSFDTIKLEAAASKLDDALTSLRLEGNEKDKLLESLRNQIDLMFGAKKKLAMKAMRRAIYAKMGAAFATWFAMVEELNRTSGIMKKFATKIKLRSAHMTLGRWKEFVEERVKMRNFINKNLFCKSSKLLNIAFRTWIHNAERASGEALAEEVHRAREAMEGMQEEMRRLKEEHDDMEEKLVKAQADKMKLSERSMKRFVNMWQSKCLMTTLGGWKAYVLGRRKDKAVMRKFMQKMVGVKMMAPWIAWVEFMHFERRCEALLDKFGRKWIYRSVVKVLEGWKVYVRMVKDERTGSEAWERKVGAVLQKMMNGKLLRIFNAWRDNAYEKRKNRAIVANFVNKMKLGGVRRCIQTWTEMVGTRKWLRRFVGRKMLSRESRMLAAGWRSWRKYMDRLGMEGVRALENMVEEQRLRLEAQFEQISELEEHIREMFGDQQERAIGVIQRMLHAKLNAGFQGWKANINEMKRHEQIVVKFGNRIRLSSAGKALQTLKANKDERQFLRKFLNRFVGGKRSRDLSAGINKWKEVTRWLKNHGLESEISALQDELDDLTETLSMYEARYAKELLAKKDKARRVIAKLLNGKIMVAWEVWVDFVKQEIHNEEIRLKFAKKLRYRGAMKALSNWKLMVSERRFLRRFLVRMIGGKKQALKAAAIRTWLDSVRGYKEGEEKEVIRKLEAFCGAQNEEISALKEDLVFMKGQVEMLQSREMAHAQKAMKNFIALWQNKGLLKVFTGWKSLVRGLNERRVLLQRVVLKWQGKLVVRCFKGWAGFVKSVVREKQRTHVVKEGEWQDFLRDARTVVGSPKAAPSRGRGHGAGAFFSPDSSSSNGGLGAKGGGDVNYGDLSELGHLSPHTIRGLSTADLQEALVKRGLPSAGSKPALIARLTACQDFLSPRSTKAAYRASHWRGEREDLVGEQIEGYAREQIGGGIGAGAADGGGEGKGRRRRR